MTLGFSDARLAEMRADYLAGRFPLPLEGESHRHWAFGGGASQIKEYELCPTKWYFSHVKGHLSKDTKATALGTACHAALESYLLGEPFTASAEVARIISPALAWLPKPPIPRAQVEANFRDVDTWPGFRMNGQIDLIVGVKRGALEVVDHKTTSSQQWIKTVPELRTDTQAQVYVAHLANSLGWDGPIKFTLSYMLTRGVAKHVTTGYRFAPEEIEAGRERIAGVLRAMDRAYRDEDPGQANLAACSAFGGCPFRALCSAAGNNPYGAASRLFRRKKLDTVTQFLADKIRALTPDITTAELEEIAAKGHEHMASLIKTLEGLPRVAPPDAGTPESAIPDPSEEPAKKRGRPTARFEDGSLVSKGDKATCQAWFHAQGLPAPDGKGCLGHMRSEIKARMAGETFEPWTGRFLPPPDSADAKLEVVIEPSAIQHLGKLAPALAQLDSDPTAAGVEAFDSAGTPVVARVVDGKILIGVPETVETVPGVPPEAQEEVKATIEAHPEAEGHEELLKANAADKAQVQALGKMPPSSGPTLYVNCIPNTPYVDAAIFAHKRGFTEAARDKGVDWLAQPFSAGVRKAAALVGDNLPPGHGDFVIFTHSPLGSALLDVLPRHFARIVHGV